jgi:hypothetical protein
MAFSLRQEGLGNLASVRRDIPAMAQSRRLWAWVRHLVDGGSQCCCNNAQLSGVVGCADWQREEPAELDKDGLRPQKSRGRHHGRRASNLG